ncbi:Hypothetical protein CINCED_3A008452 [Cinara cedri]|uniref:Uncharacterized protein n=1 Tax=Cinara cedri TaxID=506608 RepID=A0A5E4NDC1_9HEMI|nr:Hypothetical protein CINCED_3A008452 [Cinara cedri]
MRRVLSRLVTLGCTCPRKIDTLIAPVFGLVVRPTRPHSVYSSSFKRSSAVFIDNENSNAHNTMVNDPAYSRTVVSRDNRIDLPTVTEAQFRDLIAENFRPSTAEKTCDDFQKVTAYAISSGFALVDATLDTLREQLVAVLPTMTDDQLIAVFKLISLWNTKDVNDPKYKKLWSLFDEQCIERHQNWSVDKLLLVMDHWYIMNLLRFSEFVMVGVSKLASKPFRLTPKQLVQMMFYANASRKFSPSLPMYDIEQHICSNYNEFNIKELGIISLGFFKTQTHIQSQELVKNLYTSIINQIININSYELAAFLKILRYCTMHKNADSMYKLMDILTEKVDKVDLVCCTHMALLGTNLLIRHKELLKKISQQMIKKISQARIKDIERITLALTMLNYNPHTTPCIFEMVVNELRSDSRNIDFEIYTKCYISTLMSLAVNGIFPYDCISKALQYETLIRCYKKELSKSILPRDVLSLNNSVIIECPDYSGPLLSVELNKSCNEVS